MATEDPSNMCFQGTDRWNRLHQATWLLVSVLWLAACSTSIPAKGTEERRSADASCENDIFYLPNAISPNGDGVNDTWHILYRSEIDSLHLRLFNRFGQLIFETRDKSFEWYATDTKGKKVAADVYVFILDYILYNEPRQCKGSLTIFRK